MSKRIPPTSADKAVAGILERCPELETMPGDIVVDTMDDACLYVFDQLNHGDYTHRRVEVSSISLWSRWQSCRHVYRFDATLSAELAASHAPDSMPTEALGRLPYPIVYVEAPVYILTTMDRRVAAKGFFAYTDTAMDAHDRPARSLTLVYVTPGFVHDLTPVHLCMEGDTLGEVVDDLTQSDVNSFAATQDGHRAALHDCIACALSHLLYIIDAQSDQSVSYVPSPMTSRKRTKQTSRSTIHSVGVRIGKALKSPSVRYVGGGASGESGRKSPRTHVRAGHWSHYWTGPRKGPVPQTLVVRWIAPTIVGAGERADSQTTTVHSAEKV